MESIAKKAKAIEGKLNKNYSLLNRILNNWQFLKSKGFVQQKGSHLIHDSEEGQKRIYSDPAFENYLILEEKIKKKFLSKYNQIKKELYDSFHNRILKEEEYRFFIEKSPKEILNALNKREVESLDSLYDSFKKH